MITFEEAIRIIQAQPAMCSKEHIGFLNSPGRVLASPVISDVAMPPFNKAAMDGYACRREDLPGPLRVIEEIPAGSVPKHPVLPGTCASIMTGAPLPDGADCIIMLEHTEINASGEVLFIKETTKPNICYLGEDVTRGQVLIEAGVLIRPEHIAIMASAGATLVEVNRMPAIGIYSTGNELVEPDRLPGLGQIRNSNGYQILAQLTACGFPATYLGIIADTASATMGALSKGLEQYDIVVLTGGVSQGTYDHVPQVMSGCGVEVLFHHLAIQPGKPSLFGRHIGGSYVFGLPGNPVSSFVQTELLVKRLCYHLMGCHHTPPGIRMPLGRDYVRKRTERKSFIPVSISDGKVWPVDYHGSAHIQALHHTHGIIDMDSGIQQISEGELADVRLI
jgi:molybdopterin molybdotransferase